MRDAIETVIIAAVAENGVIGRDNAMPWRLKSDLRRLRAMTLGKPVLMGRKTFLSIGKALPGRTNVVITRDKGFVAPGAIVTGDIADAMTLARADALRRGASEIVVLGGGEIYAALMAQADRLEITLVAVSPEGDALFPQIDAAVWREINRSAGIPDPEDSAPVTYVTYRREKAIQPQ